MAIGFKKSKLGKVEEARFLRLINENKENLYRIAFSYVKNKEDALDVIQEATYKAYISYSKVKEERYEKTWLTRIVINTAIDMINRNKKVVSFEKEMIESVGDSSESRIHDKLSVRDALDKLNENQKTVIILRFFEDMKIDDIASVMEVPVSTVKSILYRALKKLRIDLEGSGI